MHMPAHAPCSWPTSWMHVNLWDLSPLCPVSPHTDWKSFSPSLSFILCAHTLNRWSPFDSVLFLPLSLWAPASSYLPFHPESHDTPFILSLLRLCHCLHHTLQGVAVNMRLYPDAELQHRDGLIFRNTCDAFKEVQKVILMIFSLSSSLSFRRYSPSSLVCQTLAGEHPCLIEAPRHRGLKETSWDWTLSPSLVQVS